MQIDMPYLEGRLIKRYKRFLADVELPDGKIITAHTPNTGSMLGCAEPGLRVWLYDTGNSKRKYPYSWELVEDVSGHLVGIHTGRANALVKEAILDGVIVELSAYNKIRSEAVYPPTGSRIDLLLSEHDSKPDCYVEVKNVTALASPGVVIFPDAVTTRGKKHLDSLLHAVQNGYRAAMVYCIQRDDVNLFKPADEIDPLYARTLREVHSQGVEVYALGAEISPDEIKMSHIIKVEL